MKVCVITKYVCQKISESFYTMSFEYHRANIRHLGCINVLACMCVYMWYEI